MKKNIVIGTGEYGEIALKVLGEDRIVFFCRNNCLVGEKFHNINVIDVCDLNKYYDETIHKVILAVMNPSYVIQITKQLNAMHIQFSALEEIATNLVLQEAQRYIEMSPPRSLGYDPRNDYIFSLDRYKNGGSVNSYFWQDLWAAKLILKNTVDTHYDIGSRLDGFIAHLLSSGQKVKMIDIRPLPFKIDGLEFEEANATELEGIEDGSIESMSALCSLEHFGLGRYGDPIDPEACFKAFRAIQRKLSHGGHLYISVPIGREHLEFNAHRVFSPFTIVNEFDELRVVEFSSCYKDDFDENIQLEKYSNWDRYGGERFGLFHFVKN